MRTPILASLCLLLLLLGVDLQDIGAEEPRAKPAFELRDVNGATHRLSQYRGRWVVLEWVNFACAPVQRDYQAPARRMQALQQASMERGVSWLTIDSTPPGKPGALTAAQGKATLAKHGATPTAFLLDPTGAVGKRFGVRVAPEARVVSPQGDVVYAGSVAHLHTVLEAATRGRAIPFASKPAQGCPIPYVASSSVPMRGPQAPDFTLRDNAGTVHRLSQYRGRWVVLEWVNYDCPFVKAQYHASHRSAQLAQARAAKMGVVWLTICSSAPGKQGQFSPAVVNARMKQMGATPAAYLHDPQGTVGRAYGAVYTPEIRIISPQGTIEFAGAYDEATRRRLTKQERANNFVARALADIAAGRALQVTRSRPYGCSVKY